MRSQPYPVIGAARHSRGEWAAALAALAVFGGVVLYQVIALGRWDQLLFLLSAPVFLAIALLSNQVVVITPDLLHIGTGSLGRPTEIRRAQVEAWAQVEDRFRITFRGAYRRRLNLRLQPTAAAALRLWFDATPTAADGGERAGRVHVANMAVTVSGGLWILISGAVMATGLVLSLLEQPWAMAVALIGGWSAVAAVMFYRSHYYVLAGGTLVVWRYPGRELQRLDLKQVGRIAVRGRSVRLMGRDGCSVTLTPAAAFRQHLAAALPDWPQDESS